MYKLLKMNYKIYKLYKKKAFVKSIAEQDNYIQEINRKERKLNEEVLKKYNKQRNFLYCPKCNSEMLGNPNTVFHRHKKGNNKDITCGNCKQTNTWCTIKSIPVLIQKEKPKVENKLIITVDDCLHGTTLIGQGEGAIIGRKLSNLADNTNDIITLHIPSEVETVAIDWICGFVKELKHSVSIINLRSRINIVGNERISEYIYSNATMFI